MMEFDAFMHDYAVAKVMESDAMCRQLGPWWGRLREEIQQRNY